MNSLQFLKLSTTHHMKHRNVAAVEAREPLKRIFVLFMPIIIMKCLKNIVIYWS